MESNLLDSLLDIEEQFYTEGYSLGVADGTEAGYTEGSVFAVEKGFEKFVEMGRLYGKALVWAQRLAKSNPSETSEQPLDQSVASADAIALDPSICKQMSTPPAHSARLTKNLSTLLELLDPASLDMTNTEEAVNDADERLKALRSRPSSSNAQWVKAKSLWMLDRVRKKAQSLEMEPAASKTLAR